MIGLKDRKSLNKNICDRPFREAFVNYLQEN